MMEERICTIHTDNLSDYLSNKERTFLLWLRKHVMMSRSIWVAISWSKNHMDSASHLYCSSGVKTTKGQFFARVIASQLSLFEMLSSHGSYIWSLLPLLTVTELLFPLFPPSTFHSSYTWILLMLWDLQWGMLHLVSYNHLFCWTWPGTKLMFAKDKLTKLIPCHSLSS